MNEHPTNMYLNIYTLYTTLVEYTGFQKDYFATILAIKLKNISPMQSTNFDPAVVGGRCLPDFKI